MRRMLLTAIALLAVGETATAQLNADNIKQSRWNTSYEAIGGGQVSATLTFEGQGGIYETAAGTGTLSGVNYDVLLGGGATITGRWSFGGIDGKFTFFVAGNSNPPVFSGSWQSNGRSGGWKGKFAGIAQLGGGGAAGAGGGGGGMVTYGPWQKTAKGNYFRRCDFPQGGHQLLILFPEKPQWVYWYNPEKQVFWCCCPTIRHPRFGKGAAAGQDQFLLASQKTNDIRTTEFPEDAGPNFKSGVKAKDKDGSEVNLGCPPTDLPPDV